MRAFTRLLGVLMAGMTCLLVLGGEAALAASSEFGSAGEESGQFSEPYGIAVDQESGAVYVADRFSSRVSKFGGGGEFLFAWGWGVADGHSEALQTCTTSCFGGLSGGGAGQFEGPDGVAVDNDLLSASHGDVYVVDAGNSRIEKFDSAGNLLLTFGTPGSGPGQFDFAGGGSVAVGAAGNVYVGDVNRVEVFTPGGALVEQIPLAGIGNVRAVAVDPGGDVYVNGDELSGVRRYNNAGVEQGAPRDASYEPRSFTLGFISLGSAGELFVAEGSEESPGHILEFDAAGDELASFDSLDENGKRGIAFAKGIGGLYVVNHSSVRVVSPPPPGPLTVAQSAGELQPTTATVAATLNAEGHETTYHVEYGTSVSYGSNTAPVVLGGTGFEDQPVSVPLSGLQPGTTYHYRVVASNAAGTTFGEDETFAVLPPVLIDGESVSGVTSSSATLAALLNPLGKDTSYRLEYGTSTAYGSSVPVPDGDAGSGTSDVPVSASVEGLSTNTTYHYRVVAYNSYNAPGTVVEGPDKTFTTQAVQAAVLADGRAWEMVSPPQKRGFLLEPIGGSVGNGAEIQAAADGSAITYAAQGPIDADPQGNHSIALSQILATRTAAGWSSADIATPHEAVVGLIPGTETSEYRMFSPDLSVGLLEPSGDTPLSPQATERTPYLRATAGEYDPLVTAANVPPSTKFGQLIESGTDATAPEAGDVEVKGATPDLSHVILSSSPPLTEGVAAPANQGVENLFEWSAGSLRLVSVMPDGKAATEEGENAQLGYAAAAGNNTRQAVSDDGSRVFWSDGQALYLRDLTRDMGRGETVQLDAPEAGARGGPGSPVFATASSDGSKAFFMDSSRLTVDSTAASSPPSGVPSGVHGDLYMCVVGEAAGKLACRLKDLTVDHNPGESANVLGQAIGAGEDGRYVYFVADGVLAAGGTPGNCVAEGGEACNLYVYDTVVGGVRFVARLSGKDLQDWEASGSNRLQFLTAGVSPDGRYLAFMSERSLTGYDNTDARSGQPDVEVYLYDAVTGRLVCASCDPSGARPVGVFDSGKSPRLLVDHTAIWEGHWLAGSLPGWTNATGSQALYRSRYLSNSGRLFFNSPDALVPSDANGKEDVYEYEPPKGEETPASDTCAVGSSAYSSSSAGCVSLISSGTSGEESAFLDASESGDDVFFLTAAQLAPQDVDGALDVYDAHVCSAAAPCLTGASVVPPPCTTADSCRAAPLSQPGVFGAPPSATFSGAGNLTPSTAEPVVKKKQVLTLAQKRAAALRKCRSKPRRKRAACEAQARRTYRAHVKAKRSQGGVTTKKGSR